MTNKNKLKTVFKSAGSLVWFIVSTLLVILLVVLTVLENTILEPILSTVLGGPKPVLGDDNLTIYQSEYTSKEEATKAGNELNVKIAEEGFVLLLNEKTDGKAALPINTSASDKIKVSVFGHNSVNLVLGGTGSGGISGENSTTIYDSLTNNNFDYNPTLKSFYESKKAGDSRTTNSLDGVTDRTPAQKIGETPVANYTSDVKASFKAYNEAAIVVISRVGGESFDLPSFQSDDNSRHYLQLDKNEEDMLNMVTNRFDKVIVILNTVQAFQCDFIAKYNNTENDPRIDAVLWIGGPGTTGAEAIGEILCGKVNPSGKTVDIYPKDFTKDPTYVNTGDGSQNFENKDKSNTSYKKGNSNMSGYNIVTYDESVYLGYRYYETRSYEELLKDEYSEWYEENVIFPFGYGLSYTTFEQRIESITVNSSGGTVKDSITDINDTVMVKVTVTNTGDRPGKGVAELYVTKPYYTGGIEKSFVELVDYAKPVEDLAANGGSATFTFTVSAYELASYDYIDANGNSFKGYELENGEYIFYVSSDSHVVSNANDSQTVSVVAGSANTTGNGLRWTETSYTQSGYTLENRYTYLDDNGNSTSYYDLQYKLDKNPVMSNGSVQVRYGMSRTDFESTFPKALTDAERQVSSDKDAAGLSEEDALTSKNHNNKEVANISEISETKATELTLRSLLSEKDLDNTQKRTAADGYELVAYDDEKWEEIVNSIGFNDMLNLVNNGAFQTVAIESIGKNLTNDSDGPIGFVNFMMGKKESYTGNTTFASEIVIGSTWNKDLAYRMGKIVGENGLYGDVKGNHLPYTGWYAPAVNLHRSPFSGRNFEYYSEDPVLSGKMAVNVINGCKTKGVYTDLKHFALNDQETNRAGVSTFCTEQTLREIYLKPFEIAVKGMDDPSQVASAKKDGWTKYQGTTGIMSSFNRIGNMWTGGDYRLMTEILRGEWGFNGLVICDYKTDNTFMDSRQMLYAGNDLILASLTPLMWNDAKADNAQDMYVLRKAVKNILYTNVNSNAIQLDIKGYNMEWWKALTIALDVIIPVGLAVWGFFAVKRALKKGDAKELNSTESGENA